ncbi:hypothetical protein A2U01_0083155, partial [Trifolium medium]|nr:hypothetical protein [Trifolium medium]
MLRNRPYPRALRSRFEMEGGRVAASGRSGLVADAGRAATA